MSPRTERKRAKGEARRVRRAKSRLSRRALLKGAGVAAVGLAASLVCPRMVHAILPKPIPHPTWDMLLDHVGANPNPGGVELRSWIHDLVLRPTRPQRALLLTGPETNGKTVFHNAMGLLLPEGGVVRMPRSETQSFSISWDCPHASI